MTFSTFCHKLPKVELHAHLNGSISDATICKLVSKKKQKYPDWDPGEAWNVTIAKGQQRTLDDCFVIFGLLHTIITTDEVAYEVTCDVIKEFAEENVKYLELRTTPRDVSSTGMTKSSYINSVLTAIKVCENQYDISVKLLLAIDRRVSVKEAEEVVDMAAILQTETGGLVCGIDLSGDPNKEDARKFIPILQKAQKKGLKLALHLAEALCNVDETLDVLLEVLPDRIGHGTFIHPDHNRTQEIVAMVEKHQIPFELCITSNLKSGTVKQVEDHHFGFWFDKNHPIAISTDDKGVFATSLSEEYAIAANTYCLSKEALWNMSYKTIDYIFADNNMKQSLRDKWNSVKEDVFKN